MISAFLLEQKALGISLRRRVVAVNLSCSLRDSLPQALHFLFFFASFVSFVVQIAFLPVSVTLW